jgi:hypothetical protein
MAKAVDDLTEIAPGASALDQAWKIVRLAIDEARNRYDLELYGTVAPASENVFILKTAWAEKGIWVSQSMTREFLLDTDPGMVAALVFYPSARIMASGRDVGWDDREIMDALRQKATETRQGGLPQIERWD